MKKLIKLEFNNTTRERKTEDSFSELYSYDKNNGSFEFEILNDTLTTEQVIALFKFTESNKIWKTTGTVEGNKVNVTFDTTLITQNETVICYLYFDEEQRTSDTFRFKFKVKVSEIDKMNRYEVKERFINNTVIVDRLDVVTKDELQEALKNVGGIATEGLLTEVKAEELYAKKTEAVDNTNFELVKNRVLALELKTDKDTVYDDSELKGRISVLEAREDNNTIYDDTNVRERLTALESKPNIDVNNLVTKDELASKNYLTEHQDTSNFALKSEIPQQYNDTEVKERLTSLENKAPVDLSEYAKKSELYNDSDLKARVEVLEQKTDKDTVYDDTPLKERVTALESNEDKDTKYDDTEVKNRLTELENKPAVDTSVFVTEEKLNSKGYLTQHQSLENVVTKEELEAKHFVTEEALNNKAYLTSHQDLTPYALKSEIPQPYNDTPLTERVTALESKPTTGGSVDTSNLVTKTELKEKEDAIYDAMAISPLYKVYTEETITEHLNSEEGYGVGNVDGRGGTIYSNSPNTTPYIFKGDLGKEKFVDFNLAMFTVANSIPDDYQLYDLMYEGGEDKKVLFLSNKNFSEVVPKEELKAIIREVGGTGGNIDTSHFITDEILESKNYLTQHQPLDNLVTKEELNSKGYLTEHQNISHLVTNDELNSKGYLTEEVLDGKNYLTEDVLNTKNYLTQHQDLSSLVTKQELENKHFLTEHQPLTHLATTSDLEALRNISVSKSELSKKVDTTEFNSFKNNVVTKTELAEKGYLTTQYDDTDVKNRIQALENRPTTGGTQTQDTGWIKLSDDTANNGNIVKIRRINNIVYVRIFNENNDGLVAVTNDENQGTYTILEKNIQNGFKASVPIVEQVASSINDLESNPTRTEVVGALIYKIQNGQLSIKLYGNSLETIFLHVNEFSYVTDEPFPVELQK